MAIKANLFIDQGTTYSTKLKLADTDGNGIDLTTYTANGQIRKHYSSSNSVTFTTSLNALGDVVLSLTANATANMTAGRYVYDIELTDSAGRISRIIEGIVTITPNVTR
jgi:hypothetical protein